MEFNFNPLSNTRDALDFFEKLANVRTAGEATEIRRLLEQLNKGKQPNPSEQCYLESQALKEQYKCPICSGTGKAKKCESCNKNRSSYEIAPVGYLSESNLPYKWKGRVEPEEEKCNSCGGTGGRGNTKCWSCDGRGSKLRGSTKIYKCPECNGTGYTPYQSGGIFLTFSDVCRCFNNKRKNELFNGIDEDRRSEYIAKLEAIHKKFGQSFYPY